MARLFAHVRSLALIALLLLPLAAGAWEVPMPLIPEAAARADTPEGCVEPTEEMRKNHMEMILHQRDKTVHQGVRTKQYALAECINCHVTPGPDGEPVRVDSEQHFCNSCHTYSAVSIDCFQCHRDQPEPGAGSARTDTVSPAAVALGRDLEHLLDEGDNTHE